MGKVDLEDEPEYPSSFLNYSDNYTVLHVIEIQNYAHIQNK